MVGEERFKIVSFPVGSRETPMACERNVSVERQTGPSTYVHYLQSLRRQVFGPQNRLVMHVSDTPQKPNLNGKINGMHFVCIKSTRDSPHRCRLRDGSRLCPLIPTWFVLSCLARKPPAQQEERVQPWLAAQGKGEA